MPQGSFNFSRLVRELGLKNVVEMPVRETIQPVLNLDVGEGTYPVHVGPMAISGGKEAGQAGEKTVFELHSLDPGGVVLNWITMVANTSSWVEMDGTVTAWSASGPNPGTVLHLTNGPRSISTLTFGTDALVALDGDPRIALEGIRAPEFGHLFIPRGQYFRIITGANAQSLYCCFCWCGIGASAADE